MKTHGRANLYFAYGQHMKSLDINCLSEMMVHLDLIKALERDQLTGEITRYAENEILYKAENKLELVKSKIKELL